MIIQFVRSTCAARGMQTTPLGSATRANNVHTILLVFSLELTILVQNPQWVTRARDIVWRLSCMGIYVFLCFFRCTPQLSVAYDRYSIFNGTRYYCYRWNVACTENKNTSTLKRMARMAIKIIKNNAKARKTDADNELHIGVWRSRNYFIAITQRKRMY